MVLDGSTRKKVGRHYEYDDTTCDEEIRLPLREFDPDLLINFDSSALPASFDVFEKRTFPKRTCIGIPGASERHHSSWGVWQFLRNYYRSEVRFSKEPPHKFVYMESDGALKTIREIAGVLSVWLNEAFRL